MRPPSALLGRSGEAVTSRRAPSWDNLLMPNDTFNKDSVLKDLRPVKKAVPMFTINGCGFRLYGKSKYDPGTGSIMKNLYFVFVFLPLSPIARYRVQKIRARSFFSRVSYIFLGKGELRPADRIH